MVEFSSELVYSWEYLKIKKTILILLLALQDWIYGLKCDLYWRKFHELWKRMFIPQPLKYSVGSVKYNWKSISTLKFVCWVLVFRLSDLPTDKNRFFKLPNIPITGRICLSESSSIYIMRSSLSRFGTCIIASWEIAPFINIDPHSFSPLTNFDLKFVLVCMYIIEICFLLVSVSFCIFCFLVNVCLCQLSKFFVLFLLFFHRKQLDLGF